MTALLTALTSIIGRVSRRSGDLIIGVTKLLLKNVSGNEEEEQHAISYDFSQLPNTVQGTISRLKLDGRTTEYAVCPDCHCTYAPRKDRRSERVVYQETCTNMPSPGSNQCNASIIDGNNKPKKTFLYHDFKDYLAALFARGDLERFMDDSCNKYAEAHEARRNFDSWDKVTDIFQGNFFNDLMIPDPSTPTGSRPFLVLNREDSHLVFALHLDFFNVNGMLIRGASTSCGTITMACLNLPTHIRYKAENLYLAGIIPGPNEPHLTEINHYMRPLVDDLLLAYNNGIFLTSTALYPSGRLIRCAVGPIVCDLPAGRKLLQLASVMSNNFCSVCKLYHKNNWGRTDYPWPLRDVGELRLAAERWKSATTQRDAEYIFGTFGIRSTELWRLPYLDPVKQLTVDPMHCLLEGVVAKHFRDILHLTTTTRRVARIAIQPAFSHRFKPLQNNVSGWSDNDKKQLPELHKILLEPLVQSEKSSLSSKINKRNLKPLIYICDDLGIKPAVEGRRVYKADWVEVLVNWVSFFFNSSDFDLVCMLANAAAISRLGGYSWRRKFCCTIVSDSGNSH